MADSEHKENAGERPLAVTTATYMHLQAASLTKIPNQSFVVLSFEREDGKIEQIGFTHGDGELMVSGLLEALTSLGSAPAKMLLDVLNDAYERSEKEEEAGEDDSDYVDASGEDEEYVDLTEIIEEFGETDEFGPEQ